MVQPGRSPCAHLNTLTNRHSFVFPLYLAQARSACLWWCANSQILPQAISFPPTQPPPLLLPPTRPTSQATPRRDDSWTPSQNQLARRDGKGAESQRYEYYCMFPQRGCLGAFSDPRGHGPCHHGQVQLLNSSSYGIPESQDSQENWDLTFPLQSYDIESLIQHYLVLQLPSHL